VLDLWIGSQQSISEENRAGDYLAASSWGYFLGKWNIVGISVNITVVKRNLSRLLHVITVTVGIKKHTDLIPATTATFAVFPFPFPLLTR
jgi:hypothetical protein